MFLSVVYVVRNQSAQLQQSLQRASQLLQELTRDHELIVVDNASTDDSVAVLQQLTSASGLPNLQVYTLTKMVSEDAASWVGIESALGDYVAVIDPLVEDLAFLPQMLGEATTGIDVVFASNEQQPSPSVLYRAGRKVFDLLYFRFHGIRLGDEAPRDRVLSRTVVNFIQQHPQPSLAYRHLPATAGFSRQTVTFSSEPIGQRTEHLAESLDRGMRLLVSTTRAPLRLVTGLSLFGAAANVVYSLYVLCIAAFKTDVAPGWISLSLQQSGMFFLISLVLLVLGEYILQMASLSNEGATYHVAREFTSARMTHREKLNIEDTALSRPESPETLRRSGTA